MLNNENTNTINFLSRDCKYSKHESCINKWIGLGLNFDCDCNCHKLNIHNSRDSVLNSEIQGYTSSPTFQNRKYNNRLEKDESRCNNIKNLKDEYLRNHIGEKGSSKLSFSPVFPIVCQHIIESEGDSTYV